LATALLGCENQILRWPGPFGSGFLSPQPPGVVGIGPVRRIVYPHTGPTRVGPFSFGLQVFDGQSFSAALPGRDPLVTTLPPPTFSQSRTICRWVISRPRFRPRLILWANLAPVRAASLC